jgi:hypothetical protein
VQQHVSNNRPSGNYCKAKTKHQVNRHHFHLSTMAVLSMNTAAIKTTPTSTVTTGIALHSLHVVASILQRQFLALDISQHHRR